MLTLGPNISVIFSLRPIILWVITFGQHLWILTFWKQCMNNVLQPKISALLAFTKIVNIRRRSFFFFCLRSITFVSSCLGGNWWVFKFWKIKCMNIVLLPKISRILALGLLHTKIREYSYCVRKDMHKYLSPAYIMSRVIVLASHFNFFVI